MIKFKFEGFTFEVKEVDGKYDLNDLRKQVANVEVLFCTSNVEPQIWGFNSTKNNLKILKGTSTFELDTEISKFKKFNSTQNMAKWTRYLTEEDKLQYEIVSTRGRGAKTLANKNGLVAYCAWLNPEFRRAIESAFVAISEGRDEDARAIVGSSMIDMEFVAEVEKKWKNYVSWCYETFSLVNKVYGANMVRMVLESCLGVNAKSSIAGKSDDGVIERLAEQGHGDAILAIYSALGIITRTVNTGMTDQLLKTRDGQKMVYKHFKEMLNWDDGMVKLKVVVE